MPPQPGSVEYALVLGSNQRPAHHFHLALQALPGSGELVRCAGPLRTRDDEGGRYLNAAVLLRSPLPFDALRDALQAIEADAGRERGSRTVSLDIDIVASLDDRGATTVHKPDDLQRGYVRELLDTLGFEIGRR